MSTLQWHPVPGYEHIEVTRCGRVRTAPYTVTRMSRHGTLADYRFPAREVKPHLNRSTGYLRCAIQRNKQRAPVSHHRLIALTFVAGYAPGLVVNHINGVKTDNRPENLEWVPTRENNVHARRIGLRDDRGELSPMAVLNAEKVRAIRRALQDGAKISTLATIAGVSRGTIASIHAGHTWQSVLRLEHAVA